MNIEASQAALFKEEAVSSNKEPNVGGVVQASANCEVTRAPLRADGSPLAATWIDFVVDGEDRLRREARTDTDAQFRVEGLERREYRAIALVRTDGDPGRIDAGAVSGGAEDVRLSVP